MTSGGGPRCAAPGRPGRDFPPRRGDRLRAVGVVDEHAPTCPPAGLNGLRWDVKPGHGLTRVLSFGSPSGRRDQMTAFIERREFITLLGGAAAWPLAARAQTARKRPIIGTFVQGTPTQNKGLGFRQSFLDGLRELGDIQG